MNPMQWLKAIYEAFGVPYPVGSLIAVMFLCAFIVAGVWVFTAKQYEKDHPKSQVPPITQAPTTTTPQPQQPGIPFAATGSATTHGENSPANTGDANTFTYGAPKKPTPKPNQK
jgi:hypothetical protein